MPYLIYNLGLEKEAFHIEEPASATFGRTSENDIVILEDSSISRKHCVVFAVPNSPEWMVKDLGSSNGTYLNGESIDGDGMTLTDGDIIKVGGGDFLFCKDDPQKYLGACLKPVKIKTNIHASQEAVSAEKEYTSSESTVMIKKNEVCDVAHIIAPGSMEISQGQDIEGYKIIRKIGGGRFSTVYLAYQKSVDRTVALKIFRIIQDFDPAQAFAVFKDTVSRAAKAENPYFVHYFDCGLYDGHCFLSMAYFAEGTLEYRLSRVGKIFEKQSLGYIASIASALDHAAKQGVYHFNLNPGNIVFNDNDSILVSDYGISEWEIKYAKKNNIESNSYSYSAPELADGMGDIRADIYSLGIIFYNMLNGISGKNFRPEMLAKCKCTRETVELIKSMTEASKDFRLQSYDPLLKILGFALRKVNKTATSTRGKMQKFASVQQPKKIVSRKRY